MCVSALSACVRLFLHVCARGESMTMTTSTRNPEYQRTSSGFEFRKCSEGMYDNKLHLNGVGIQVTKALIHLRKMCSSASMMWKQIKAALSFCHTRYISPLFILSNV